MENKIVAFVDILGFTKLIKRYDSGEEQLLQDIKDSMDQATNLIKFNQNFKTQDINPFFLWKKCLSVRLFSDCLCLASPLEYKSFSFYEQLNFFYKYLMGFQSLMMEKGFFVRGAVTIGSHYVDENIIFSGGLVEAYELEKKIAKYPRIIISEKLIQKVLKEINSYEEELDKMFVKDCEGVIFFNHFNYNIIDAHLLDKFVEEEISFNNLIQGKFETSFEELDLNEKNELLKKIKKISETEIEKAESEIDPKEKKSIIDKHKWLIDFIDFELKINNTLEFKSYKNWC